MSTTDQIGSPALPSDGSAGDGAHSNLATLYRATPPEGRPAHSPWQLGRLCNQLDHFLQLAWITNETEYQNLLIPAWDEVLVAVSRMAPDALGPLLDLRTEWNLQFTSEWRSTLLHDENAELARLDECSSESQSALVADAMRRIVRDVDGYSQRLRDLLMTHLSADVIAWARAGEQFDRLVRPVPAWRSLTVSNPSASQCDETMGWEGRTQAAPGERWMLPCGPTHPVSLQDYVLQLRFTSAALEAVGVSAIAVDGVTAIATEELEDLVVALMPRVAASDEPDRVVQTNLGLRFFDDSENSVEREGHSGRVSFGRKRVTYLVLREIAVAGDDGITDGQLAEDLGCEETALGAHRSCIRRLIAPLGINWERMSNERYRLVSR